MTAKTKFWIADSLGRKALVEGAEERDRWIPLGWAVAEAPSGEDWVWLVHQSHGGGQWFPHASTAGWGGVGWKPGPPEEPADFTKDPALVDVAAHQNPAEPVSAAAPSTPPASGSKKES